MSAGANLLATHVPAPSRLKTYYILDRQSGGLLGPLRDLFSDKTNWFALYAVDGRIDDETLCNKIKRGIFGFIRKDRWVMGK